MEVGCKNSIRNIFAIITARKRSLWQGDIFTGMYQSFCPQGEGVSLTETSLWTKTPGKERAVRILLECILVLA